MIDWLAAGGQLDELVRLANNAPDWIPPIGDKLIHSSREFVAGFVPPDYLIDGLIQRRYFYSMTAPTGAGKTCVAIRIAAHAALGLSLDGRNVEKVRVLFLAGENPDDVRARWIKLCEEMGHCRLLTPARLTGAIRQPASLFGRSRNWARTKPRSNTRSQPMARTDSGVAADGWVNSQLGPGVNPWHRLMRG